MARDWLDMHHSSKLLLLALLLALAAAASSPSSGSGAGSAAGTGPGVVAAGSGTDPLRVEQVPCRPSAGADATATCLQAALDAALPGDVIEVPFSGEPWVVSRPLILRRDGVTLHFLPGVVLEAQRGQFHGETDCLLTVGGGAAPVAGVTVRGSPGARLRMHRADYANSSRYSKAEWRHGLQLVSVRD